MSSNDYNPEDSVDPTTPYPDLRSHRPSFIDPQLLSGVEPTDQENGVSVREIIDCFHEKSPVSRRITTENCGVRIEDSLSSLDDDFPKKAYIGKLIENQAEVWMYMKIRGQQRCEAQITNSQGETETKVLKLTRPSQDMDQVQLDNSVMHLKEVGHNYSQLQRFTQLALLLRCADNETIRLRKKDFELKDEMHRYFESAIRRHCKKLDEHPHKDEYTHDRKTKVTFELTDTDSTRTTSQSSTPNFEGAPRPRWITFSRGGPRDPYPFFRNPPRPTEPLNELQRIGTPRIQPRTTLSPARHMTNPFPISTLLKSLSTPSNVHSTPDELQMIHTFTSDQLKAQRRQIEHGLRSELENIEQRKKEWNEAKDNVRHWKQILDEAVEREQVAARAFETVMDAHVAQMEKLSVISQVLEEE